jgi:hypothetical protein
MPARALPKKAVRAMAVLAKRLVLAEQLDLQFEG